MTIQVDNIKRNGTGKGLTNTEIRKQLECLAKTTASPAAKEIAEQAVKFIDRQGGERLARAVAHYVDEKAETERINRQLLWAMPIVLITAVALLMHALKALI